MLPPVRPGRRVNDERVAHAGIACPAGRLCCAPARHRRAQPGDGMPAGHAGLPGRARMGGTNRCDPTMSRAGASPAPASGNRKSASRPGPGDRTFVRYCLPASCLRCGSRPVRGIPRTESAPAPCRPRRPAGSAGPLDHGVPERRDLERARTHPQAAPGVMPCFPGNLGQADGLSSPSRPEIPITGGGPHDCGRSVAPGPARAAPIVLHLGQQIIGVGLDEQLHERRMHDAPPRGRRRCSLRAVPFTE
jgi:hypothetical protein